MKVKFLFLLLFANPFFVEAQANIAQDPDTVSDIIIQNQQIISSEKVVGKIKILDPTPLGTDCEIFQVEIFAPSGEIVAQYNLQVLNKHKKKQDAIIAAQVKTSNDGVLHNGNNFIDFHFKSSKKGELLQLDKVVEYLLKYKYL